MALQNIGAANSDDAFYRYKMPRLITKIEGRGNGIKTNLVNMVDVAKALARPASYTTKYFGCELGAQSKYDDKTGTSIVNGAHDTGKLAGLLEGFIKRYVQCYGCGNPETEIVITKIQTIQMKCAACGHLSDVDMRDKLTTFILKNPPEVKKSASAKDKKQMRRAEKERLAQGEAADEEMKKSIKKPTAPTKSRSRKERKDEDEKRSSSSDDKAESVGNSAEDRDEDDVEWQTDTSAEAAKRRIREQLTAATSEMVVVAALINGEEEAPMAASPTAKKTKEDTNAKLSKSKSAKKITVKEGDAKTPPPGATIVAPISAQEEIAEVVESLSIHDKLVVEVKGHLKMHGVEKTLSFLKDKKVTEKEAMAALFEALFGGISKGLSKEVKAKKMMLAKVIQGNSVAQKNLLGSIEVYCGVLVPDAVKEVPLVLKVLYDEDLLEEEEILGWFDAGAKANADLGVSKTVAGIVRKHAKPLIEWLRSAEPESDEN